MTALRSEEGFRLMSDHVMIEERKYLDLEDDHGAIKDIRSILGNY